MFPTFASQTRAWRYGLRRSCRPSLTRDRTVLARLRALARASPSGCPRDGGRRRAPDRNPDRRRRRLRARPRHRRLPTGRRDRPRRPGADFEQSTHTFEPSLQAFFLLSAHWLIDIANQLYLNAQFSIALGFLVWLYLFRNESYYFVRNMFVVSMGLALIGYTLFPTAPPRMFPSTASSTQSPTSPTSTTTRRWRKSSSTPTRRCRSMYRLRGDDRRHRRDGLLLPGRDLLGPLAALDRLGRDRHRQPLLGRRRARLDACRLPR
ncbi:MAG: phosphatase PAP2 family protein [Solirubrobacterales bacterium]